LSYIVGMVSSGSSPTGNDPSRCGCFCCLETFDPGEVFEWIDDGETPTCPRCGIAAVLPGVTDYVELLKLRHTRFGPLAGVPLPDEET